MAEAIVKTYGLAQDGAVFTSWIDEYGKRHAIGGEEADQAVRAELAEAERRALALVKDHESIIRALADALVEHETLDAAALDGASPPEESLLFKHAMIVLNSLKRGPAAHKRWVALLQAQPLKKRTRSSE